MQIGTYEDGGSGYRGTTVLEADGSLREAPVPEAISRRLESDADARYKSAIIGLRLALPLALLLWALVATALWSILR